jgi:osmotically-inducible protein OsmY
VASRALSLLNSGLTEIVVPGTKLPATDEQVTQRVQTALVSNSDSYVEHVTVTTKNGAVHLPGSVHDYWELSLLLRATRRLAGVQRVVNELDMTISGGSD